MIYAVHVRSMSLRISWMFILFMFSAFGNVLEYDREFHEIDQSFIDASNIDIFV